MAVTSQASQRRLKAALQDSTWGRWPGSQQQHASSSSTPSVMASTSRCWQYVPGEGGGGEEERRGGEERRERRERRRGERGEERDERRRGEREGEERRRGREEEREVERRRGKERRRGGEERRRGERGESVRFSTHSLNIKFKDNSRSFQVRFPQMHGAHMTEFETRIKVHYCCNTDNIYNDDLSKLTDNKHLNCPVTYLLTSSKTFFNKRIDTREYRDSLHPQL